jgi:hypothetical protein
MAKWSRSTSFRVSTKLRTLIRLAPDASALHVYSKRFDSCVAFDMEKHLCWCRSLKSYGSEGVILPE